MNSFNPTTKTQEALQQALQDASSKGNPDIRPAHLLAAILSQKDGIAAPVLKATAFVVDHDLVVLPQPPVIDPFLDLRRIRQRVAAHLGAGQTDEGACRIAIVGGRDVEGGKLVVGFPLPRGPQGGQDGGFMAAVDLVT